MIIASKLPPEHVNKTYFNLGRSAFAYLVQEIIKPQRVFLPAFTCWSLVSTMQKKFPDIELKFYNVDRNLKCDYPKEIEDGELFLFIHFFGHENKQNLPKKSGGVILEDISHSYTSRIDYKGDYTFGSLRKTIKISDGGIILNYFLNPIYERENNLDSWLRHKAIDWKDVREAENMLDRSWSITDISSQSLEILLTSNLDLIRNKRYKNEKYLYKNIKVGYPLINYSKNESPLVHNRIIEKKEKRDYIRKKLAQKGIFTSIHWPTHELVKKQDRFPDVYWLEGHIISIPVSQEYNLNDMEYIAHCFNKLS
jgi:dTDP-4-amino-4,6-dideoxygalactose transaminase